MKKFAIYSQWRSKLFFIVISLYQLERAQWMPAPLELALRTSHWCKHFFVPVGNRLNNCPLKIRRRRDTFKGSHSMRDGQILLKISSPLHLMKDFCFIPLSAKSISMHSGFRHLAILPINKLIKYHSQSWTSTYSARNFIDANLLDYEFKFMTENVIILWLQRRRIGAEAIYQYAQHFVLRDSTFKLMRNVQNLLQFILYYKLVWELWRLKLQ